MWDFSLELEFILRILLAAACGSAIGLERGFRKKEAGQRTHCVIAVGACVYTLLSVYAYPDFTGNMDITYIACQIVCGVGFLGVGIIYKSDTFGISGLSTATGLWATAAIGMACGAGMYELSILVSLLIVAFHIFLNVTHMESFGYTVQTVRVEVESLDIVYQLLRQKRRKYRANLLSCEYTKNEDKGTVTVAFKIRMLGSIPLKDIMAFTRDHKEIKSISV